MPHTIWILTGEKQIGKTTFLQQWVEKRNDVIGFLSPVVGEKRFFYDIEQQIFTHIETASTENENVLVVGRFRFSKEAFEAVEKKILAMLQKKIDAKILVIDEIGTLELEQKKGLCFILIQLLANPLKFDLLLVVRSSLITAISQLISTYGKPYQVFSLAELKIFLQNLEH
jgi:nucleoside-triphosphatase THEP1